MKRAALLLALACSLVLLSGCISQPPQPTPTPAPFATPSPSTTPTPEATPALTPAPEAAPSPTPHLEGGNLTLLMLGRSVTENWAGFMGLEYDGTGYSGDYGGFHIITRHIDTPPDLPDSVDAYVEEAGGAADAVFFKLCFEDFSTEEGSIERNEGYVQRAYETAVVRHHKTLIMDNALPMVQIYTTPGLVQNHLEYDAWLEEFARTHSGVCVLDLHGALATPAGYLNPDYASAPDDSHPNERGYEVITPLLLGKARNCG